MIVKSGERVQCHVRMEEPVWIVSVPITVTVLRDIQAHVVQRKVSGCRIYLKSGPHLIER